MEQRPLSEDTSSVDTASPRMRQNRKDTYNRNEKGYSSGADLREHMAQWNRIKSSEIYSPFRKILARVMDISRVTSVLSDSATLRTAASQFLCPRGSPGKNTGVGCHALLQGMLQTQELNSCLMSPALAGRFFTTGATWEAQRMYHAQQNWYRKS